MKVGTHQHAPSSVPQTQTPLDVFKKEVQPAVELSYGLPSLAIHYQAGTRCPVHNCTFLGTHAELSRELFDGSIRFRCPPRTPNIVGLQIANYWSRYLKWRKGETRNSLDKFTWCNSIIIQDNQR
jgi:hypothetical protein